MSEEQNTGEQVGDAVPVESVAEQSHTEEAKMVPLDALKSEREQRQKMQEELQVMKDHMMLMQNQQTKIDNQRKEEESKANDDDILTVGEVKKLRQQDRKEFEMSISELRMTHKHNDYNDVITNYLPEVLKQNPNLRKSLEQSQDFEMAYYLAKNSEAYRNANKKTKVSSDAEKIMKNSESSGSLSGIGSSATMNEAKRYKSMSDDEFKQLTNKNMGIY
jgi:hypothetical protein